MSNFEIEGKLIVKEDVQDITASFKKREFVIEVVNERNSEWNDFIKFQLTQDKCSLIDKTEIGEKIKVAFNIRGRKWEKDGKTNYFSNLEAWKVEKTTGNASQSNIEDSSSLDNISLAPSETDDLPF